MRCSSSRELAVEWQEWEDGLVECTVVARDRRGLLATVAGVLTLIGFDIQGASGYSDPETGMALELYRGVDRFGRLDEAGRRDFATMLRSALDGTLPLRTRLSERIMRYRGSDTINDRTVDVQVDVDASTSATVIEVHAPDDVGPPGLGRRRVRRPRGRRVRRPRLDDGGASGRRLLHP